MTPYYPFLRPLKILPSNFETLKISFSEGRDIKKYPVPSSGAEHLFSFTTISADFSTLLFFYPIRPDFTPAVKSISFSRILHSG